MNTPESHATATLIERLAAIEHERWAHWQRYMHDKCEWASDGSLRIPADLVEKWTRQMDTPYEALTDKEKQSDRDQVARYLPTVVEHFSKDSP